jgi:serine/threonine protein kinase
MVILNSLNLSFIYHISLTQKFLYQMPENNTTLEGLVRSGKTLPAIDLLINLIKYLNDEPLNSLTLLSNRFYQNRKAERDNSELRTLTNMEKDRITYSFLNILSEVKEEIQDKVGFYKSIPKDENENNALQDFLHLVLAKKYEDIQPYAKGHTFHYFSAREIDSKLKVIIMLKKQNDINRAIDKNDLNRIAALKHRNLIQLLDANMSSFPNYIITEYVEGISLKNLIQNIGALPLHSAKRLMLVIGEVMILLKQKRFPYAGIRPSKIMIDYELEPEISPFDILMVDCEKRLLKSFIEDAYYFAPEKLYDLNKDNSPTNIDRANQFCMAALGYEMITGQKLFNGSDISNLLLDRNRFFTEENYRKKKFENPRLTNRLVVIFRKMLQFNPLKRYADLPTALREISKVRAEGDGEVETIFNSYKRCLHDSDDFVSTFYDNLIKQEHSDSSLKEELKKDKQRMYEKFYLDIHLVFDPNNTLEFLNKITANKYNDVSPISEYKAFLEAFLETIETCDPRWKTHAIVRKAWQNIKNKIFTQLQSYEPEPEVPTDYEALPLSYMKANKAENAEPPSESSDNTIMEVSGNTKLAIPQACDLVVKRDTEEPADTFEKVPENTDMA